MRDAETFTVDDPRFTTAQVVGPSMLSLDGAEHAPPPRAVRARRSGSARCARASPTPSRRRPRGWSTRSRRPGEGELRRGFAGPLAAAT